MGTKSSFAKMGYPYPTNLIGKLFIGNRLKILWDDEKSDRPTPTAYLPIANT
jgi:hypothetical protein